MNNGNINLKITGDTRDIVTYADGREETFESHNLVVNSATSVITMLLADPTASSFKYWAIGSGSALWDTSTTEPSLTDVALVNEIGRKEIQQSNISYIDSNGVKSVLPTNRVRIEITFGTNECNGDWREFGIFCGNTATSVASSGIMFNNKRHTKISKGNTMSVKREIIFTISLV